MPWSINSFIRFASVIRERSGSRSSIGPAPAEPAALLSALQSSVLFRGGRPRPLVAVVPTRTRSNCVTARWGGKQRMRTRSTAMTSEHDSASIAATSLLGTGEVCWTKVRQSLRKYTDARKMPIGVVDGSRSGKEDAGECRRSVRVRPPERTPDRSQSRHRS